MRIFLTSVHRVRQPLAPSFIEDLVRCAQHDHRAVHSLVASADEADCVLITEAWRHFDRPFFLDVRRSEVARAHREKTFIYCDADKPPFLWPGLYPSVDAKARDPRWQDGFCYLGGERRWLEGNATIAQTTPDLLFSFSGSAYTHRCRREVLALRHPRGQLFDSTSAQRWGSPGEQQQIRHFFVEQMARSQFVLCPRGKGPSSFRLFETLASGRVPVIISDAWVPPPGVAWETCTIRVPESEVATVPELLESLEDSAPAMGAEARRVYDEHFSTRSLFHYLGESLQGLLTRQGSGQGFHWRSHVLEAQQEAKEIAKQVVRGARHRRV